MDEKKALEMRADNLTGELQKGKNQLTELEGTCQQLQVCSAQAADVAMRAFMLAFWYSWLSTLHDSLQLFTDDDLKVQLQGMCLCLLRILPGGC